VSAAGVPSPRVSASFPGALWAGDAGCVWNAYAYAVKNQQMQGASSACMYAGSVSPADVRRAGLPPSVQASGGMVLVFRIISDT
jgi:hypothetical protein